MKAVFCLFFAILGLVTPFYTQTPIALTAGLVITNSCQIATAEYRLQPPAGDSVVITIKGNGITVDFAGATLRSKSDIESPHLFKHYGIRIEGENITIKNARIYGFKSGIWAINCPKISIESIDCSYNYRPLLLSNRSDIHNSDGLDLHNNDQYQWRRQGAGILLENCPQATVKDCKVTGGQHGLLASDCNNSTFYNNFFYFNSGIGIGICRTSDSQIMHNRLDWNVRGYSENKYASGQRSAGILLTDRCNKNTIAYNSATHCGNGFYSWAGEAIIDRAEGEANNNLIFGNDFSHSVRYGVITNFSRNRISGNLFKDCETGIWSYFAYDSEYSGNWLAECQTGIWLSNTQRCTIRQNLFTDDSTGLRLTGDLTTRPEWAFARGRDIRSTSNTVDRNVFLHTRKSLEINNSRRVNANGENLFFDVEMPLIATGPADSLQFLRNDLYGTTDELNTWWSAPVLAPNRKLNTDHTTLDNNGPANPYAPLEMELSALNEPDSLPDGMLAMLPSGFPTGKQFIVMNNYGPYDFRYPTAIVESENPREVTFTLIGPAGDWEVSSIKGGTISGPQRGILPATITVKRSELNGIVNVIFRYTSPDTTFSRFGTRKAPGEAHIFSGTTLE
jgi:parallel beta-helix repeat protein